VLSALIYFKQDFLLELGRSCLGAFPTDYEPGEPRDPQTTRDTFP
jgi:hypothetical protein